MSAVSEIDAAGPLDILVVEDHPDTLKYLALYLESLGHRVRTAETQEQALRALAEDPGDVLISDIGLAEGDGWELLLRARLPASVYAIAMSGYGLGRDQIQSREAGFRHHLIKPFSPDLLEEFLCEAAKEKAARAGV